ncbi:unnamed protein product [Kuraishia capsulata CBS 1993]|uniref:F-box domain-containing protein n=1 Tax=Kuraishia capsulata CBS 1993 TaxID=1382522 RepID=W6MY35_9ASCO|nr:uncharacterized protein KUCA_T00005939001 [Kuraishia capsulata CBS 1993]CDK29945.1 unnamed protein product [Kuraishia capsulata CBS 1993]
MEHDQYKQIDQLITEGCRDFARQRYDLAIHHFTRGMNSCKYIEQNAASTGNETLSKIILNKLVALYDYRAACYEKQKDLKKAYLDATKIVKIAPTNCRGYLRLCKVRLARGENRKALETLERGVRVIKREGLDVTGTSPQAKLFKRMVEERDALSAKIIVPIDRITEKRCLDPAQHLPFEILEKILRKAGNTKFILRKCMYVSKRWTRAIQAMPSLFQDLELLRHGSSSSIEACLSFLNQVGDRHSPKVFQSLKVVVPQGKNEESLRALLTRYPISFLRLHINLPDSLYLFFLMVLNSENARSFAQTLTDLTVQASLPKLCSISWMSFLPNLRTLDLRVVQDETKDKTVLKRFGEVLDETVDPSFSCPQLEEIIITSGISLRFGGFLSRERFPNVLTLKLRHLNFNSLSEFPDWHSFFGYYETICLQNCDGLSFDLFEETANNGASSSRLKWLTFSNGTTHLRQPFKQTQLLVFNKLEYLNLTKTQISLKKIYQILSTARDTLTEINLSDIKGFSFTRLLFASPDSEFSWKLFLQNTPNLKRLTVQEGAGLNDHSLKELGDAVADFVSAKILSTGSSYSFRLELLDLSYNDITRRGLIGMFQNVDYIVKRRTELAEPVSFFAETLVLGGIGMRPEDEFFMKSGFCSRCIVHRVTRSSQKYE